VPSVRAGARRNRCVRGSTQILKNFMMVVWGFLDGRNRLGSVTFEPQKRPSVSVLGACMFGGGVYWEIVISQNLNPEPYTPRYDESAYFEFFTSLFRTNFLCGKTPFFTFFPPRFFLKKTTTIVSWAPLAPFEHTGNKFLTPQIWVDKIPAQPDFCRKNQD